MTIKSDERGGLTGSEAEPWYTESSADRALKCIEFLWRNNLTSAEERANIAGRWNDQIVKEGRNPDGDEEAPSE